MRDVEIASDVRSAGSAANGEFVWHQRFPLAPGVYAPGRNDIERLWRLGGLPDDLTGLSVLDIGTTNGGAAFLADARGATLVVATDIVDSDVYAFEKIRRRLGSSVHFVRSSLYDLPARFRGERFDLVIFWGVLYHLRHPLLGLDAVRAVASGLVSIETAVLSSELPVSRFHRRDELLGDPTNWFSPTVECVIDWCGSAGLDVVPTAVWPENAPARAMFCGKAVSGPPEFVSTSAGYEQPLTVARIPPLNR